MIAKLKGIVDTIALDHLLIDVNGICYQVSTSTKTLAHIGAVGDRVVLYTEMLLRNELPQLIGFYNTVEQDCFRLLTTVQGVGARVALAILSVLTPDELTLAIYNQDKAQITRADGVGPKLALRIISELKDKVSSVSLGGGITQELPATQGGGSSQVSDAFAALESLGYRRHEAAAAIQQAMQKLGSDASTADIIRIALSTFSNRIYSS
ncbi:Holliday junction branch migration protein RuvA [Candidatus Paracaedibacter symbiosus]|uniref:Holliday junction branch migration protein RuvA n=1 Tax=Candidatus Paracaedibacter symbiosus TaxID=244582 RepID=UPI000509601E|nr:Holliday junction branch migration protein RuvA [Candidatus Paracaedibacter symbiosus]